MPLEQSAAEIRQSFDRFVEEHGAFTAFCVHLGDGVYTMAPPKTDRRLRRFVQCVADLAGKPIDQLRVLDLACLEGHYAIEFGLHGARAVGIEVRKTNLDKGRFLKDHYGLDNVEFFEDDVRNLSAAKYGRFDVVICAGLLYHLDFPDNVKLLEQIHEVCDRLAIIETYVSMKDVASETYKGHAYWGRPYQEHPAGSTAQDRYRNLWASIDNPRSFWLTRASLCNALAHLGFTSVYEQLNPSLANMPLDRATFVALKGHTVSIKTSPMTDQEVQVDWAEKRPPNYHKVNQPPKPLKELGRRVIPQPIKNQLKEVFYRTGLMRRPAAPDFLGQGSERFFGRS